MTFQFLKANMNQASVTALREISARQSGGRWLDPPAEDCLSVTPSIIYAGAWLKDQGYKFTAVTPASHARVMARPGLVAARDLRSIFGWNRPFASALIEPAVMLALRHGHLVEPVGDGLLRSRIRFSSLDDQLFAHSAYPTQEADSVFFGPDTVRFVALIKSELERAVLPAAARILDVGCGAGPGGIVAAMARTEDGWPPQLMLADINPQALAFARANASLAGIGNATFALGDLYEPVHGLFDLIVANPPYLNDIAQRTYRHGGGTWGEGLSVRILREGLPLLAPGGRLVLYTGAAVIDGQTPLLDALNPQLRALRWPWSWRELDPDVFGEELSLPAYEAAERIAAVALVVQRPPA